VRSRGNPRARGIEERLAGDGARDPVAEDVDLDLPPLDGIAGREIRVRDRLPDRVAVAAARDAAHDSAVDPHRLGAERDRTRVAEHETAELALRLACGDQRLAADEVVLVELHGEAEARLERRLVGSDVGAPHAVALLEPQRVDRLVPARDESMLPPGVPDRVPKAAA